VPSTPPTGAELALCVATETLLVVDVLLVLLVLAVLLELVVDVFDEVLELVLLDVFELVLLDEVLELEVLGVDEDPHVSGVGTTCVDTDSLMTTLSACFVKCAECVFVIRCSCLPWSTPTAESVFDVTTS
jgi:hypothetical protein